MSRLTKRTAEGYAYLANVKEDEQEVDSPYRNTLQCILDSFEKLAKYEDLGEPEELRRKSEWISVALEKQEVKPPEYKVHEKYPSLGKNYYCSSCGVMFIDFENNSTNYCGNCGQKLKADDSEEN